MSLINKMLQDLEERQALAGVADDEIIRDLRAVDERGFLPDHGRSASVVAFLVLIGVMLCYLGYDYAVRVPVPILNIPGKPELVSSVEEESIPEVNTDGFAAATAADSEVDTSGISLKLTSLRIDATMPVSEDMASAEELEEIGDIKEVKIESAPAPASGPALDHNRLLHIGLTDLEGSTAVQVNTSTRPDYAIFVLEKPDRLLVEIKDLEMPKAIVDEKYRGDAVARLRYTTRGETSLLIFDLNGPVAVNSSDIREIPDGSGFSLDIVMLATDTDQTPVSGSESALLQAGDGNRPPGEDTHSNNEIRKTVPAEGNLPPESKLFRDGITALQSGDVTRAMDLLSQTLMREPRHLQARESLAGLLLQQGDTRTANKLLLDGIDLHPGHTTFLKLYAKQLYEAGDIHHALAYLRKTTPAITDDPDYYALLAAVLQRGKYFREAGEIYQRLLAIRPENGVWWMGLGISLEGMGERADALQAYMNAGRDRSLEGGLRRYVSNRIRILGG